MFCAKLTMMFINALCVFSQALTNSSENIFYTSVNKQDSLPGAILNTVDA